MPFLQADAILQNLSALAYFLRHAAKLRIVTRAVLQFAYGMLAGLEAVILTKLADIILNDRRISYRYRCL